MIDNYLHAWRLGISAGKMWASEEILDFANSPNVIHRIKLILQTAEADLAQELKQGKEN